MNNTYKLKSLKSEIEFYCENSFVGLKKIKDNSVDCILTDPPYKYLKNQKLDVDFDEVAFFNEAKRILTADGFIVLFGRGASFYRWNTILNNIGFIFKEEIIWNKRRTTSPSLSLSRVHETIAIMTKKSGIINKSIINYGELKGYDVDKIYEDIKRLGGLFNKKESYLKVINNIKKIQNNQEYANGYSEIGYGHTFSSASKNRCVSTYTINAMEKGCREQSIINDSTEHYAFIHPTQKPVRLLERLLALTTKEGDLVIDPFAGSCSCGIACYNTQRNFIGYEIDEEYYQLAKKRLIKIIGDAEQIDLF